MLYDKRWDKPEVKADPHSLPAVIAWLETMPADVVYCYTNRGTCLAAQYHQYCGTEYLNPQEAPDRWTSFDETLEGIAQGYTIDDKRTFGAALDRARNALAEKSR